MNTVHNYSRQPDFTGRCVQVRDAQWVCHTISSHLPHISTTKMKILYGNAIENRIWDCKKTFKITAWRYRIINRLNNERENYQRGWHDPYNLVKSIISQLQKEKLGNCSENADIAEVILKMNGVKNARTAGVRSGLRDVDHKVCVFNTDGSEFKGKITPKTIIVDPWLGIADFAKNIFLKYKNIYQKYLGVTKEDNLRLSDFEDLKLISQDIEDLREEYPQFVFKSKTRKFMQN